MSEKREEMRTGKTDMESTRPSRPYGSAKKRECAFDGRLGIEDGSVFGRRVDTAEIRQEGDRLEDRILPVFKLFVWKKVRKHLQEGVPSPDGLRAVVIWEIEFWKYALNGFRFFGDYLPNVTKSFSAVFHDSSGVSFPKTAFEKNVKKNTVFQRKGQEEAMRASGQTLR